MDKNEIKKALYKQNPTARFSSMRSGLVRYFARLGNEIIVFIIPISDMGEAEFKDEMDSKLLIRWIYQETSVKEGELVETIL